MDTLRLLRYQHGTSWYHRHHSLLKLSELMVVCAFSGLAPWQWSGGLALMLLGLLACVLPWRWWARVLLAQCVFVLVLTLVACWSFSRALPWDGALSSALNLTLPLSAIGLHTLFFIRYTEPLGLMAQLQYLVRWRWVRTWVMLTALVLLFFPLLLQQLRRRLVIFSLRGGQWRSWWRSWPVILAPLLLDIERRSLRVSEALELRTDWKSASLAEREPWRVPDALVSVGFVSLALLSWSALL